MSESLARHYGSPIAGAIAAALLTDDPAAGQLLLVRHGQQLSGDGRSADERRDPPLTDLGHRQAAAAAAQVAGERLAAVYCSMMRRACQTAEPIAERHGLSAEPVEGLHEVELLRDVGADDEVRTVLDGPEVSAANERFLQSRRWDVFPRGETGAELRGRVVAAIEAVLARHRGESVAVVCHGGVINAYLAHLLEIRADMWFRPAHASVHRLWFAGERRVIHRLNEVEHLTGAEGTLLST